MLFRIWLPDQINAVFTAAFGFEHCHVGFFEQFFGGFGIGRVGGQPAADGQGSFAFWAEVFKRRLLQFCTKSLGHKQRLARMLQFGAASVMFARRVV